ncbi:SGNH/GDSL hydrolase family protein [Gemmatimonadota bacterium]
MLSLACQGEARPGGSSEVPVDSLRFLALGDSYTIGESVEPSDRWPEQLSTRLRGEGVPIESPRVVARTGWTTDELQEGIDAADPSGPYSLVTLLIGVNDQYRGRPVEEYRGQFAGLLRRAVGLAGGEPARVLVLSIPDWGVTPFAEGRDRRTIGEEIDSFNRIARVESGTAAVRWVDVTGVSREVPSHPELVAQDGLHPSGEMYARWVDAVLPTVREILGAPPV